jgi:hypothetical protein
MHYSWTAFSVAFCIGYAIVFAMELPLFLYYPMESVFTWHGQPFDSAGPSMAWYGLVASAAVIALPAGLLLPDARIRRWLHGWLWLPPVIALFTASWLLRAFFRT